MRLTSSHECVPATEVVWATPKENSQRPVFPSSLLRTDWTPAKLDALWIEQAQRSPAENRSTLAVLDFSQLTRADTYLVQLREKGYIVREQASDLRN